MLGASGLRATAAKLAKSAASPRPLGVARQLLLEGALASALAPGAAAEAGASAAAAAGERCKGRVVGGGRGAGAQEVGRGR